MGDGKGFTAVPCLGTELKCRITVRFRQSVLAYSDFLWLLLPKLKISTTNGVVNLDLQLLKLTMGVCLLLVAWLVFSLWREKLSGYKEEERVNFLMYNIAGGGWLFAIFALCGGFYFLLDPILG